jgi:uncharacterized ubiquitin-like protein YukD
MYVQIINGEVKNVWDSTPPEDEDNWHDAVEVFPEITADRQYYGGHTFDLDVDPVQIIYAVVNLSVADRKINMGMMAKNIYGQIAMTNMHAEVSNDSGDAAAVKTAKDIKDAAITAINNCTTHDELDAL